jgi:hypothetical protein
MAKLLPYNDGDGKQLGLMIYCPACKSSHAFLVNSNIPGQNWSLDGNMERPTFSPSMLVRGTMYPSGSQWPNEDEHKRLMSGEDMRSQMKPYVCHSFVRDGKIQYLNDCTHALKGQTIDLPEHD